MKELRLRVKKEIILWDDFAGECGEEFTLNPGEEYNVIIPELKKFKCRDGIEREMFDTTNGDYEVYVPEHEHEGTDAWFDMVFDSEKEFWEYWEEIK